MIRVWVARDSTNHPVRNSTGPACSTPIINPNVRKSKSELMGPNVNMNRRMNAMFQCEGATPSACSLTGRARSAGVVTNYVLVHTSPLCQLRVAMIPGLADAQLWRPHGMPCLIPPDGTYDAVAAGRASMRQRTMCSTRIGTNAWIGALTNCRAASSHHRVISVARWGSPRPS